MRIRKIFKYDGKINTLLQNLNEADLNLFFNVDYPGKKQGKEPNLKGYASKLTLLSDTKPQAVPKGSYLYKDFRSTWHILTPVG